MNWIRMPVQRDIKQQCLKKKLVYAILLSIQISKGVEIVYIADGRGLTGGCLSDVSYNFQVHLSHPETSHPHSKGIFKKNKK